MKHLIKTLIVGTLAIGMVPSAQAANHCDPRVQAVGGPVAQDLSNLVATKDRPCQGIENQIATTQRQIAEAEQDLKAAALRTGQDLGEVRLQQPTKMPAPVDVTACGIYPLRYR